MTAPLFTSTNAFNSVAYCGFVGTRYKSLKTTLCSNVLTSAIYISFSFVTIGIVIFCVMIMSTILAKRIDRPKIEDGATNPSVVLQIAPAGQKKAFEYVSYGTPPPGNVVSVRR